MNSFSFKRSHRSGLGYALAIAPGLMIMAGCGGGGGASAPGNPLTAGRSALVSLASGSSQTTTQTLQNAVNLFQQAAKNDPTSVEARFGEAVSLAGLCSDLMDGGTTSVTPATGAGSGAAGSSSGSNGGPALPGRKIAAAKSRDNGGGQPVTTFSPPAAPSTGTLPPTPSNVSSGVAPVPGHSTLGLFWFLDRGLSNPYTLLETLGPVTDLHLGLMSFSGYAADSTDVARRQKLVTDLGTVLDDLAVVEADSTFSYTLPAPDQNGQTVTIGLPEVYLFDAYINSLRTEIALSLAYVRDPGTYNPIAPPAGGGGQGVSAGGSAPPVPPTFVNGTVSSGPAILIGFSFLDTNKDGKLEPSEYLPPSPFLTLRDATMLQLAQKSLAATAAKETLGIAGVLARPSDGSGGFLLPNTPQVATILNTISTTVVPLIAQAAVGPVTLTFPHYDFSAYSGIAEGGNGGGVFQPVPSPLIPGGGATGSGSSTGSGVGVGIPTVPPNVMVTEEKVTINLTAWFNNPPQDLKAFAPTYTLNSDGTINGAATVYPDPTFGGLFPQGLPADMLP